MPDIDRNEQPRDVVKMQSSAENWRPVRGIVAAVMAVVLYGAIGLPVIVVCLHRHETNLMDMPGGMKRFYQE